jgi:hypothetical protein
MAKVSTQTGSGAPVANISFRIRKDIRKACTGYRNRAPTRGKELGVPIRRRSLQLA